MTGKQVTRRGGMRAPARELGIVLAGALVLAAVVPTAQIEDGPVLCPFRLVTGLPCPACGLTRSWVRLAHGRLGDAIADHAAGPLTLALAVVTLGWVVRTQGREKYPPWLRRSALAVLAITTAVGVMRLGLALT